MALSERSSKDPPPRKPTTRGRPVVKTFPGPIPDTIENVAASVLGTPPKQDHEWQYLKNARNERFHFGAYDLESHAISPLRELGAYEALWNEKGMSFKKLAEKYRNCPDSVLSDFVSESVAESFAKRVRAMLSKALIHKFGVRVHGTADYPLRLRAAAHPVEFLYFRGNWDLIHTRSVAVVGTRNPSKEGEAHTRSLVKKLVADNFTIVSGLAKGIDTVAHNTAIETTGRTIGVIGTPLSSVYPKENKDLQERIASDYLLISQVPVWRYSRQGPQINKLFFPERNVTMSALTEATLIVEAGETSGTLIQARAALQQGRKLFILNSCFENKRLTWPARFAKKGAIRVMEYADIRQHLGETSTL